MRQFAMAVAAVLVFALVSPAFAQPFADTPTNHWAYDAIAELAAKGLIEGYPDGTFKGDRAMTRYEMAMVVARLLARIESIQIPAPTPPPPPEVTKADIDTIMRLVNEFRAELAAKNVRLTAVEEELNAIKARLDNVRVTGGLRFREDLNQLEAGKTATGLNGNPNTGTVSASNSQRGNRPRYEFKLGFDGSVAPDLHFITALESTGGYNFFNSSASFLGGAGNGSFGSVDSAFLDWKPMWAGGTTEIWFGRFGCDTPSGGGCYPVQFGPFGLLLNDTGDTWGDSTGESATAIMDGLRVAFHLASVADLQVQGVWARIIGNTGSISYPSGEDMYGIDANVQLFPGLRLGADYVANTIGNFGSSGFTQPAGAPNIFYHVYGPGNGSLNPATARCLTVAGGITCPAQGNGWGAYVQWDAFPGIHLDVEAAQWSDSTAGGGTDNGYNAVVTWNLNQLFGILPGHNFIVTTGYNYYGTNFYTPYGAAESDIFGWDALYPGNGQGLTATVSYQILQPLTVYLDFLTGNSVSNSQPFQEWEGGIAYSFSANAKITLKYRDLTMNGVDQQNVYRAQIDYSF
ncbi:MAG TPA: S-layer homology domain-containing protein [bacterium]|nr:S-layer homology domain-containing protein [bacterium]